MAAGTIWGLGSLGGRGAVQGGRGRCRRAWRRRGPAGKGFGYAVLRGVEDEGAVGEGGEAGGAAQGISATASGRDSRYGRSLCRLLTIHHGGPVKTIWDGNGISAQILAGHFDAAFLTEILHCRVIVAGKSCY